MIDRNALTKEQKEWFSDRMEESHTGRLLIPSYLYAKFRKIVEEPDLSNIDIFVYFRDYCY